MHHHHHHHGSRYTPPQRVPARRVPTPKFKPGPGFWLLIVLMVVFVCTSGTMNVN